MLAQFVKALALIRKLRFEVDNGTDLLRGIEVKPIEVTQPLEYRSAVKKLGLSGCGEGLPLEPTQIIGGPQRIRCMGLKCLDAGEQLTGESIPRSPVVVDLFAHGLLESRLFGLG